MAVTSCVPEALIRKFSEDLSKYVVPYNKTVSVKKHEPRMFMGKDVPEGATHCILEGDNVVFFMMHPRLGMCVHVDHEGVSSWINYRNTKYPAHTFYELIKLPEQENRVKELTLKDLDDGVIIVMPSGFKYKVHRVQCQLTHGEPFAWSRELEIGLKGYSYFEPTEQPKSEEENIMKKEFSKADLRSGHKVKCRNGNIYTVFLNSSEGGKSVISRDSTLYAWCYLDSIRHDLTSEDGRGFDIIEVYSTPVFAFTTDHRHTLIWKREEKTPEQLAYEALQAQIAEEEARHADSIKALREQAEKLKPKIGG